MSGPGAREGRAGPRAERPFRNRHGLRCTESYDAIVLRRLKWLGAFAIDYGSIATFVLLAAMFQLGNCAADANRLPGAERGPEGWFGLLFAVVAVKLWHDVREDRRRGR